MKNIIGFVVGLVVAIPLFADTTREYPEPRCSTHIQYVIKDENGNVMSDANFQRYWPLTCSQQVQIWYLTLEQLTSGGEQTFTRLTGKPATPQ